MNKIEMIGNKYGSLLVLFECGVDSSGNILYRYRCDCGVEKIVSGHSIRKSESCGCKSKRSLKHGLCGTKEYKIWTGMRNRCNDLKNEFYGGRGIRVCKRWESFENFLEDMGKCPHGMSIDRINNYKGYSKSNCRWATDKQQGDNKRTVRMITYKGKTMTMTDWAKDIGTSPAALHYRLVRLKLPSAIALSVPVTRSNRIEKFLIK